jgi:hypothetical protein
LLALDQKELVRIKREEDRLLREELEAIAGLRRKANEIRDDRERFDKVTAEIAAREATFPVPFTFGLYLPPKDPAAGRISHLSVLFVSAIIRSEASAQDLIGLGLDVRSQAGKIFTAYVPLEVCDRLSQSAAIDYVELSRPWRPQLDAAIPKARIDQVHISGSTGTGVIVGIIEQSPLDFYHEHFRNNDGSSRVLYLWDQTLTAQGGESGPTANAGFATISGVEYNQSQINSELNNPPPAYRKVRSEPVVAPGANDVHGTAVASCAAGSGHVSAGQKIYLGAAPKAEIIYVRTEASEPLYGNAFADSANVLDAFAYIFGWASQLNRPCVVNLSLSDNLGAHDGSSNGEQFLDALLSLPGRAITCSAGNQNFVFEHHTRGTVTQGSTTNVVLIYEPNASNSDTLQLWYDGHDEFTVTLRIPTSPATVIGPIASGSPSVTIPVTTVTGATIVVSVDSGRYPNNGDNRVEVRVILTGASIPSGNWILELDGLRVINGAFHAWVDRNNGLKSHFELPVQDEGTISVPSTAHKPISVGAHDKLGGSCESAANAKPSILNNSGCGPTRDGRIKPEIAGPGEVQAALARNMNQPAPAGYPLGPASATSVAAPIVAGAAALLFQCKGNQLTCGDLKQLLIDFASQPNAPVPSNAFGFGYLCMDGICTAALPSIDVWIKDSDSITEPDDGTEPYMGSIAWMSPDITVLDAAGNPTPNPTYDPNNVWNNLIDVTIRNRGTNTARNIEVFLYWADPATNIPYPGEWKTSGLYIGGPTFVQQSNKNVVDQLASGAAATVRFAWAPPAPGSNIRGDDHFCLIARLEHQADPSNVGVGGWPVIAGRNNIALRNLHVQGIAAGEAITAFLMNGTDDEDTLELLCEELEGDVELILPTRALPWRELALLERRPGRRPYYGCNGGIDPAEAVWRVLDRNEVMRIRR